jgi:hypothetical protein
MSTFKQFLASDIIVTPFEVNKGFTFNGEDFTNSDVSIDRFLGKNIQSNPFISGSNPTTGFISIEDQELIYNSVKELYYSNHISSSYSDVLNTASLVPGKDTEGDRLVGTTQSDGRYFNYPQTDLTFEKYFPTGSTNIIGVISIPSRLYGNYIQPNSFNYTAPSGSITDDGEGNIIYNNTICGNIFYDHGLIILTSDGIPLGDGYGEGLYGSIFYGLGDSTFIENFVTASNVTCSFSSSLDIFETQYKCTLRESEFNFSLNPSIISGSTDGTPYGFVTESYFSPYVTTVGLYDEYQNLLAVGKLSQPLPTSPTTDTTILINIDR